MLKILFLNIFIVGCSNNNISSESEFNKSILPEELYELAINELKDDKIVEAKIKFEEIEKKFPLSSRAIQSKIMLAFIDYLKLNYNEAIYSLNAIFQSVTRHILALPSILVDPSTIYNGFSRNGNVYGVVYV